MLPLAFTTNKVAIRSSWDKPIIAAFSEMIQEPLDYFGLPGPDIQDLIEWREHLRWKTSVEYVVKKGTKRSDQLRKVNTMQKNAMLNGLNDKWEIRKGSLEDIILRGVDIDGNKPALLHINANHPPVLVYSLHNWDFQGGLYKDKNSESKRIEAIKHCIKLQKAHPFLFLLTLNVRHTLGDELSTFLNGAANETSSGKHKEILAWYSNRGRRDNTEHYRIKAVVPLFVRTISQVNSFDCYCYPPLYYEGPREHLLHFAFRLTPKGTVLPTYSKQLNDALIELPLIKVKNGEFVVAEQQHPHFSPESLKALLQNEFPVPRILSGLSS